MDTTSDAVTTTNLKTDINTMCSIEVQLNGSFRHLQCSMSSLESESDLSLAFEQEDQDGGCDEMPAFEIRALSPHGRTPSPINDLNLSDIQTPKQHQQQQQQQQQTKEDTNNYHLQSNPDFVALHEINAQISPPSDANDSKLSDESSHSLETIFEGVFLHTPPREKPPNNSHRSATATSRFTPKRVRANLMELVVVKNIENGKENRSPLNNGNGKNNKKDFT